MMLRLMFRQMLFLVYSPQAPNILLVIKQAPLREKNKKSVILWIIKNTHWSMQCYCILISFIMLPVPLPLLLGFHREGERHRYRQGHHLLVVNIGVHRNLFLGELVPADFGYFGVLLFQKAIDGFFL